MPSPIEFRLREMRERAGMSVEELAELTNQDAETLHHLDSGRAVPQGFSALADIAIALGCTLDELAGIEEREGRG